MTGVVEELSALMDARGRETYGEAVTVAEHMLLTAAAAEADRASEPLVAAALLHDVGHLLVDPDDEFGRHDHADLGGDWVSARFGPDVSEPVRLHVQAKRYLCARVSGYHDRLSTASRHSLERQGGPMTPEDATAFEAEPHATAAVRLRRLEDDRGKQAGLDVPALERFRPMLERLAERQ